MPGAEPKAGRVVRIGRALGFAGLALAAGGCVERGDFGRVRRDSAWNDLVGATGSIAAGRRGEPVSTFALTDDEEELRGRAWRFLIPARSRSWFDAGLADLRATGVLPRDAELADPAAYHAGLTGEDARSAASRYRRLGDDALADLHLLDPLAELASRVAEADRVRLASLEHVASLAPGEVAGAQARVAENRCLVAWVTVGIGARIAGYRYALDRLVIEVPQRDAVPVERSLARLRAAQAGLGFAASPRLAGCAGEVSATRPAPSRPAPFSEPAPLIRKG